MDLTHGVVYCFVCRDNVYDLDLEKIGVEQGTRAWKALGKFCSDRLRKKKPFIIYVATVEQLKSQMIEGNELKKCYKINYS